ncbi:Trafficking kinesin-binding protein 1 [Bienertia sinuspersici]
MEDSVTLRIWHGGLFKVTNKRLEYVGGHVRTFAVDPDELCWFYLKELALKCGQYNEIHEIYYLLPHCTMDEGLKRVYDDKEVLEMCDVVLENRGIDLFAIHNMSNTPKEVVSPSKNTPPSPRSQKQIEPSSLAMSQPSLTSEAHEQEKNPESRPSSQNIDDDEYYQWYDCRPESPIPLKDLIPSSSSEYSDPSYEPPNEEENVITKSEGSDLEVEEEFGYDLDHENEVFNEDVFDSSDDELRDARERKKTNAELFELSQQVQKEAIDGASRPEEVTMGAHDQDVESGYVSEYVNSEEEELTPDEDGDGEGIVRRRRVNRMVVSDGTDWTTFEWKVGHRFPNRKSFKDAVARYAIFQGRNLSIVLSDKKRGQRLGVKCMPGCEFSLYASWNSATSCFIVKSVKSGHCCVRNMEKNKQLKSTWMAQQFLEIFKARPHWPAKDIIETVKRAYKVIIKKDLAYKVKYEAHRMLHGSMKEHYMKVRRYLAAIKETSPESMLVLVTDEKKCPPVFKRLFVCFDGIAKGWIEGCRKVLCIDACFLKTFLGGQLLAAVGRDGNDQMYPVAWAVVEGENNDSWEWFMKQVKECLLLNDGTGLAIISDEHQVLFFVIYVFYFIILYSCILFFPFDFYSWFMHFVFCFCCSLTILLNIMLNNVIIMLNIMLLNLFYCIM